MFLYRVLAQLSKGGALRASSNHVATEVRSSSKSNKEIRDMIEDLEEKDLEKGIIRNVGGSRESD